MDDSCEYAELTVVESKQGVVLQLEDWTWVVKISFLLNVFFG
jgi:hypothetical protein